MVVLARVSAGSLAYRRLVGPARQGGLKAGRVNQIGAAAGAGSQGSLKAGRVNQVGAACWCSQAGWLEGRPEQPGW